MVTTLPPFASFVPLMEVLFGLTDVSLVAIFLVISVILGACGLVVVGMILGLTDVEMPRELADAKISDLTGL